MITYTLSQDSRMPLYEQLYRLIREDIRRGRLEGGTRLPSKRAFARQLGISIVTVENAYAQLEVEGYVETRQRKGYFVTGDFKGGDNGKSPETLTIPEGAGIPPAAADGDGHIVSSPRQWFADFASNQTERDSFPFATWAKITRCVLSSRQEELLANSPSGGVQELRQAICDYLRQFRGIACQPEQIVVGAGTEYLYGLLVQLLGFDKIYACETPGYPKVPRIFACHGILCRPLPLDEAGLSAEALRQSDAQILHVMPSHHFPTGITMPAGRRYELLSWAAAQEDRWLLEDDYDSEFRLSGRPVPALFAMDSAGRTIYLNTFTRSLSSTIRVSYMILPPLLLERFRQKLGFYACTVPNELQYTLAEFISGGYFEKHINRMRNRFRKKRDLLLKAIAASELNRTARITGEDAGLHFLMTLPVREPEELFLERLSRQGIRLRSLESFQTQGSERAGSTEEATGNPKEKAECAGQRARCGTNTCTYVVNYSSVPGDRMEEAVRRICEAFYHTS